MPTDHIDNLSIEDLEMEEIRIEPWAELSVKDLEEEEIGRRQSADLSIAYLEEAEMRRETLAQVPRNEDYQADEITTWQSIKQVTEISPF